MMVRNASDGCSSILAQSIGWFVGMYSFNLVQAAMYGFRRSCTIDKLLIRPDESKTIWHLGTAEFEKIVSPQLRIWNQTLSVSDRYHQIWCIINNIPSSADRSSLRYGSSFVLPQAHSTLCLHKVDWLTHNQFDIALYTKYGILQSLIRTSHFSKQLLRCLSTNRTMCVRLQDYFSKRVYSLRRLEKPEIFLVTHYPMEWFVGVIVSTATLHPLHMPHGDNVHSLDM